MSVMIYEKHSDNFIGTLGHHMPWPKVGENISINRGAHKKPDKYFVREVIHYIDVNDVTTRVYVERDIKSAKKHYLLSEERINRISKVIQEAQAFVERNLDCSNTSSLKIARALSKLTKEDLALLGLSDD